MLLISHKMLKIKCNDISLNYIDNYSKVVSRNKNELWL